MSFEQNTMETIEKIVRNLDTITNSIVDLYGKLDELVKSVEKIKKLTAIEEKVCDFCGGSGRVINAEITGTYVVQCPRCDGTGKIKVRGE